MKSPKGPTESLDPARPKRGRGRPAYLPPWLEPAASLVAQGLTLRRALWRLGVYLSEKDRKNIYRWKLFRKYYEEARGAFVAEWGTVRPSEARGSATL